MQPTGRLDDIDDQLLALLRQDARQPIAQLAKGLNIPRSQLYSRLARLEESGIVVGYTVRLGEAFAASRIRAHMMIKTLPRFHREVEAALERISLVQAIHAISGEYDVIAMLEAEDGRQLNDVIDEIGLLEGVERTTTSVILATKLER
ncbi:Lrp/AsnC family transcriptional regulator [Novosphingobium album (ex Liu et al. 2023)]|uniref:Lrp/AsnC family transcriptional regulator n=1 Tax=Novosphingobium album (ex Liu et al. 2023) TaxID=3031130 RepID=A0ABT5WMD1_9SPHN|nr:Lrp/AsnC family transcriptional regulator [Novosphingobium album (ex Liu et al. 2023)]MDE8651205.1 Lrp/AsnC family transcriptional regulator [Novosphingobium album (ex Liu et al. 2023)]